MDWYLFFVGVPLLINDAIKAACGFIIIELVPAKWFYLAQAAPSVPDIGAAFDKHGVIGILFWIIAVLGAVVLALVGAIIILYKKEDKWIASQESLLKEHFAMKDEWRSCREEVKVSNANYNKLMERYAWQRGDGD